MNRLVKRLAPALVIVVLLAGMVPSAMAAPYRGWENGRGHVERHESHGNTGCVACGVIGGLILGGVVGGLIAHAVAPPPVVAAPAPACYTQPGYWGQAPVTRPDGYTSYQSVWVPPQTVCQ